MARYGINSRILSSSFLENMVGRMVAIDGRYGSGWMVHRGLVVGMWRKARYTSRRKEEGRWQETPGGGGGRREGGRVTCEGRYRIG